MKPKKWKYDKKIKLFENVKALADHHGLPDQVAEDILTLSKRSYTEGSNNAIRIWRTPL